MREKGWYDRPGVKVLEGRWQDFIESEDVLSEGGFDIVYTDTFSEDYQGVLIQLSHYECADGGCFTRAEEVLRLFAGFVERPGGKLQFLQWTRCN